MNGWEYTINTGNPDLDRQQVEAYRQSATASGMQLQVQQLPTGGYHVRMSQAGAAPHQQYQQQQAQPQQPQQQQYQQQAQAQQQYQQQQAQQYQQQAAQYQQPQGTGQPYAQAQQAWQQQQAQASQPPAQPQAWQQQQQMAFAGAGAGAAASAASDAKAPALSTERLKYIRKVYLLLSGAVFTAILAGFLCVTVGGTTPFTVEGHKGLKIQVPAVVAAMLENPMLMYASFGVLFAMTFVASWTSKVKGLNLVMLFLVSALMGLELAPMVFVAQVFGGLGDTLSANPVRDAGALTGAVFIGCTAYVSITKKDFSFMRAFLVMGSFVVFVACLLTFVFQTEIFSLAVASVGALLAVGWILYQTSWIFRKSRMDDAVGDALVFLVQIRNLFMFLLRILMSRR